MTAHAPTDRLQRRLRDLRISVTDRCNFRCSYCMPKEVFGRELRVPALRRAAVVSKGSRASHGCSPSTASKVRLTGGEPLPRCEVERLIEMLAAIDGISDVALTTNGAALAAKAHALKDAGLTRVTVSLDSLDDHTFAAMNDVGFPVTRVLEGIDAAAAGLSPVKISMVVKRAVNDDSIVPMADQFRHSGHILRVIEYMDVGTTNGWRLDDVVRATEIHHAIDKMAARAATAAIPRRSREPLPLQRRSRRNRPHRLRHPTILRQLHPRPPVRRRQAPHLPVRQPRPRPARHCPQRRHRQRTRASPALNLDRSRRPLLRSTAAQTAPARKIEMSYIGG